MGGKYDEQPALKAVKLCKQYLELWHQIIPVPEPDRAQLLGYIPREMDYADTALQEMKNVGVNIKPVVIMILLALTFVIGWALWPADHQPRETSLKQAIELCLPTAFRWSSDARLTYVISTEAGEYTPGSQGQDGLRSNWNIIFVNEKTGQNLLVAVRQGRIAYTRELLMAFKEPIDLSQLKLDSSDAVKHLADSKKPLPDRVHFELINQTSPVLRVYLVGSSRNLQIACMDEATGEVISNWCAAVN